MGWKVWYCMYVQSCKCRYVHVHVRVSVVCTCMHVYMPLCTGFPLVREYYSLLYMYIMCWLFSFSLPGFLLVLENRTIDVPSSVLEVEIVCQRKQEDLGGVV